MLHNEYMEYLSLHEEKVAELKNHIDLLQEMDPSRVDEIKNLKFTLYNLMLLGSWVKSNSAQAVPVDDEIINLVRQGERIKAIKLFREIHNTGLKDSKDAIDRIADEMDRLNRGIR